MDVEAWARDNGVALLTPDQFGTTAATDPRLDFGGTVMRTPRCVLRPQTLDELSGCLRALAEAELTYKLRGAGYSAGGQVLSDGGVIVELTRLAGIVADDPEKNEVTVLGGTTWLALGTELRKTGRRPLVLAENLHMTIGGTLAVGGIGDTTTVHGLAIQGVTRLVLVTPDGALRRVGPDDRLFRAALGGSGVLGALGEITLKTARRAPTLVARTALWGTLDGFLADAAANADQRLNEVYMGGMVLRGGRPIFVATLGNFGAAPEVDDPSLYELKAAIVQPAQVIDRFETQRQVSYSWGSSRPSMQVIMPMASGRELVDGLARALPGSALGKYVERVGLVVFRGSAGYPMAPLPAGRHLLAILLRAEVTEPRVPEEVLANLKLFGERALEAGGRVVMTSIDVGRPDLTRLQLGDAWTELEALRSELDPKRLCNRDVLPAQ